MNNESKKIGDETIGEAIKALDQSLPGNLIPAAIPFANADWASLLDELLRFRRISRASSRRAEQIKRLRWQAETLTTKAEEIVAGVRRLGGEDETLGDLMLEEQPA